MEKQNISLLDRFWLWLCRFFAENKVPFLASFAAGLLAHGYAFTNKLVNHDEVESLFGKGATITSGRWGLEAIKFIFPDASTVPVGSFLIISLHASI